MAKTLGLTFMKSVVVGLLGLATILVHSNELQAQKLTGLSDWTIFLDPGHAQKENKGVFDYSEAEKVLRVALAMRDMLQQQTDIKAVYMARTDDVIQISLPQRTDLANSLGADFYYSIHSDAGDPSVNSTLMLYGGWKKDGVLVEKIPNGGGAYGDILDLDLTGAMRIGRRGNFADRVYYDGNIFHHTNQWSYLHVNRQTTMASLLSEAGFHTNPRQQQLNMNAQWKVLEALSAFRSLLELHGIDRPAIGVATGVITDQETGRPLNGATVTIGEKTYTTDTWESLFFNYSNDPEQIRNGFYYLDGLTPNSLVEVHVSCPGYHSQTLNLTIKSNPNGRTHENLSFLDIPLLSATPAAVVKVEPAAELQDLIVSRPLLVEFSRPMNRLSVEQAIGIVPAAPLTFNWIDDYKLQILTGQLSYNTAYVLTIDGGVARNKLTEQWLDGDSDGIAGGDFVLNLITAKEDLDAPLLVDQFPQAHTMISHKRPVIRLVYDEVIVEPSIPVDAISLYNLTDQQSVAGVFQHMVVYKQSVLHFFPTEDLPANKAYQVRIVAGLADQFGNATEALAFTFYTLDAPQPQLTVIDHFNGGIVNWFTPQGSGTTTGIVTEVTNRQANADVVNIAVGSTASMRLNFGWDEAFTGTPYIRLHLPATASQNAIRFNSTDILRVWLFGDGSGSEFRFMIRDGSNHLEASAWLKIDWIGWKLISWDMSNDPVFGWSNGNGKLDGANFYLDGLHLRYAKGLKTTGSVYFDHLHFVKGGLLVFPQDVVESFEDFDDFSTQLAPWQTIDAWTQPTVTPQGFDFAGSGNAFAYSVFNPSHTMGPIVDTDPAQDGSKYLVSVQSQNQVNDKWLVSDRIKVTPFSMLKFYARSLSQEKSLAQFQVWVIEDNVESALLGSTQEATASWEPYAFDLGPWSGKTVRFAVRDVSEDGLMLLLDNFKVSQEASVVASVDAVEPMRVAYGTTLAQARAALPGKAVVRDNIGRTFLVNLTWSIANYNATQEGDYAATGAFQLPTLVAQSDPETPLVLQTTVSVFKHVIASIAPVSDLVVAYATSEAEVIGRLAASTTIKDSNNQSHLVSLNWILAQYNPTVPGEYTARGEFVLPAAVGQSDPAMDLAVNAKVTVKADDTALAKDQYKGIRLYPNPASDLVHIHALEPILLVRVFSVTGQLLYQVIGGADVVPLDVKALQTGFYVVQVQTGVGMHSLRMQIVR